MDGIKAKYEAKVRDQAYNDAADKKEAVRKQKEMLI